MAHRTTTKMFHNKNLTNNLIRILTKYGKHEGKTEALPTLGTYPHSQSFLKEGVELHEDRIYLNQAYHYLPWYKFLRKRKVRQDLVKVCERLVQHEKFVSDQNADNG